MLNDAMTVQGWLGAIALAGLLGLTGCASGPAGRPDASGQTRPAGDGAPTVPPPPSVWEERPVEPQVEPIRSGGPNKPYEVLGERYEPLTQDAPWREAGLASWYGTKFHGKPTASGELYSMYGMTAAHKTLPIPSYVRVRSKVNGESVILRVNDRGPFVQGRVIDVSYAAAIRLGLVGRGVGEVEVERLTFEDIRSGAWRGSVAMPVAVAPVQAPVATPLLPPATATASPPASPPAAQSPSSVSAAPPLAVSRAGTPAGRGFWVQLAALSQRDGVDRLQQRVARELSALLPMLGVFQERALYKLKIGPFDTRAEAQDALTRARAALQLEPMLVQHR